LTRISRRALMTGGELTKGGAALQGPYQATPLQPRRAPPRFFNISDSKKSGRGLVKQWLEGRGRGDHPSFELVCGRSSASKTASHFLMLPPCSIYPPTAIH
jgi:hypothetical protein